MDDKYYLQDIFGREDEKNIFITSFQNYPTTKNHVYYFHGESGVGKTTLFDYLCNLINLQNESDHFFLPIIASKSLTQKTGTRHLYKMIKESNEKIYFSFPRYEIACRFLYRRLNDNEFKIEKTENGVDAIIDEIKNVVEFEKPVDTFIVNMIIRCFYKSITTLVNSETKKYQERQLWDFVQDLQGLNINDIENKLTDYLIDDINQSLKLTSFSNPNYHLIFAVDAFEKRSIKDGKDWLGYLIQKVNKSLWYVFGIEKNLKELFDSDNISFEKNSVKRFMESNKLHDYLRKRGISNKSDREYIISVSKGLPASINILIEIYKNNGNSFNHESESASYSDLFKLYYSKHLSNEEKRIINLLSVFDQWDYSVFRHASSINYISNDVSLFYAVKENAAFAQKSTIHNGTFVLIDIVKKTMVSLQSEEELIEANKVKYLYFKNKTDILINKISSITSNEISNEQFLDLSSFASEAIDSGTRSYVNSEDFFEISDWCTKTQQFMSKKGLFVLKSKLIEIYIQNVKQRDDFKFDDDSEHKYYFQNVGDLIWAYRKSANKQAEMNLVCDYYIEMIKRHGINYSMFSRALYYMGLAFFDICDYNTSKHFLKQCLQVCNEQIERSNISNGLFIIVTNTLGCLNMDLNCFDEAKDLLENSLSLRCETDIQGLKTTNINLSRLYFRWARKFQNQNNSVEYFSYLKKAEEYLDKANEFQERIAIKESYSEKYSIEAQRIILDISKRSFDYRTTDISLWQGYQRELQKIKDLLKALTNENTEQFVLSIDNNIAILEAYQGNYEKAAELLNKCLSRKKLYYGETSIKEPGQNINSREKPSIIVTQNNLTSIMKYAKDDPERIFFPQDFILQY